MSNKSKILTVEERSDKLLKEEKIIVDVELTVKKEKLKKRQKNKQVGFLKKNKK